MLCKKWDIVAVPFPFIENRNIQKKRPVLVLSSTKFNSNNQKFIGAMITTAKHSHWGEDVVIKDLEAAGLPKPSVLRFKVFTLPIDFCLKKLGELAPMDLKNVKAAMNEIL